MASDENEPIGEAELARVLAIAPRGAMALAGLTLGLLMVSWLAMYFFLFLPRGPIG